MKDSFEFHERLKAHNALCSGRATLPRRAESQDSQVSIPDQQVLQFRCSMVSCNLHAAV